jgi:hypothetical protein
MSVLDPNKTYKNLKKKGFSDSTTKSVDHKRLEFHHEGKFVLSTKISHSNGDIDNYLIKQMSVQCKLDKDVFFDLAKCPLSQADYLEILAQKGLLD